jgi:ABC-type polar amino acid transport system ATPase subunit
MIRVSELEKKYASGAVLRGVSLEVRRGGLAAVLGLSGAGKSTLLRCLVGLESFDAGSIAVEETVIAGGAHKRRQRLEALRALRGQVGLVFQSFELFPHLDVLDNCALAPMKVKGVRRDEAETRALTLLEQLGMREKARAYPDHLSGGQRQRVAIARALAMEPRVLLYDEPTSALDASFRREVKETLLRVQASGVTQVVVTHDVALARDAAEQVFILDAGRIVEEGPTATLFAEPKEEATRRLLRSSL